MFRIGSSKGFTRSLTQWKKNLDVVIMDGPDMKGTMSGDERASIHWNICVSLFTCQVVRKIQSCSLHLFLLVLRRTEYEQVCMRMNMTLQSLPSLPSIPHGEGNRLLSLQTWGPLTSTLIKSARTFKGLIVYCISLLQPSIRLLH